MKVKSDGLNAAITGLGGIAKKLENPAPLMHQLGQMLSNSTVERFHTAKAPEGQAWQKLKPATIQRKGNAKILVASGEMMNSITFTSGKLSALIYSDDSNQGKVEGHQYGNPARNLPKRAIFGLSRGDIEDIENTVTLWLEV